MKLLGPIIIIFVASLVIIIATQRIKNVQTSLGPLEHGIFMNPNPFNLLNLTKICRVDNWLNTARALTPQDFVGRIILLDFWTYCCINCIHVIPDLISLEETFKEKLTVIGIHSAKFANEKDEDNIRSAILRYNITHPVVNDKDFTLWNSFDIHSWPTFIVIDPEGSIYKRYAGEGNKDKIQADIQLLINTYKNITTTPLPIALEKDKQPHTILQFPGKLAYAEDIDGAPALFISDSNNNRILATRLDGSIFLHIGQEAEGLLDGTFQIAQFNKPQGLLWDNSTKKLYIADTQNHALRVADMATKNVITLAGNGKRGTRILGLEKNPLQTSLASPWDLAFFPNSNTITIAMAGTHQLWTYNIAQNSLDILAGNGTESITDGTLPFNTLSQPSGLAAHNEALYFVDSETSSLRTWYNGGIITLIGSGLFDFGFKDGQGNNARLQHALGLCVDADGAYIADSYNHAIRYYDFKTGTLTTICGDGISGNSVGDFAATRLNEPNGIIKIGNILYVTDTNNHRIIMLNMNTQQSSILSVMPTKQMQPSKPSETLPNVKTRGSILVAAQKPLTISLKFVSGFGLNKEAPSWLALFDDHEVVVQEFSTQQLLQSNVTIAALRNNATYRLQGTLYYCKQEEHSACLIQSVDNIIHAHEGQTQMDIEINIV